MRNNSRAFEQMAAGADHLRRAGVPFGFIFTLTFHNLDELDWVADYAVAQGASLLQIHPLEEVGRASAQLRSSAPDALELARGFIEIARLREQYADRITLQYDVADREILRASPERGFAMPWPAECGLGRSGADTLANLIAPIIIEADGAIVPIQYNFSRAFQIGDIFADCLSSQIAAWKAESHSRFLALCRDVHQELLDQTPAELPFVNWYGAVLQASQAESCAPTPGYAVN
jgi:MoaA/NifB/PqqE/SkfB family radical SAM enzyme